MLADIETYYDGVPRISARAEQVGPFTVFVKSGPGWPFYARPSLGASHFEVEDVERVRQRQRQLGIPETFEWVAETTPALRRAVTKAGLRVTDHPLMVLRSHVPVASPRIEGLELRLATLEDDFATLGAVGPIAFGHAGTRAGAVGIDAVQALAAEADPEQTAYQRARVRAGHVIMGVCFVNGVPVGIGGHLPVGSVSEVAGVGVIPALRRRGIAAALTSLLVGDALGRGMQTVFLSAGDSIVARVYQRVGFERVGTACMAEPASA